jgi:hypothetical protein
MIGVAPASAATATPRAHPPAAPHALRRTQSDRRRIRTADTITTPRHLGGIRRDPALPLAALRYHSAPAAVHSGGAAATKGFDDRRAARMITESCSSSICSYRLPRDRNRRRYARAPHADAVAELIERSAVQGPMLARAVAAAAERRSALSAASLSALLRHREPAVRADCIADAIRRQPKRLT